MKLKNINLLSLISLITVFACVALCFQGCGKHSDKHSHKHTHSGPVPLDGQWTLSQINFPALTAHSLRPSHDARLEQVQSQIHTANRNTFISFEITGQAGAITLDLSPSCCQSCTLRVPTTIRYSKPKCCSFVTMTMDRTQAVETPPGCISNYSALSMTTSGALDLIESHLGKQRWYSYGNGSQVMIGNSRKEKDSTFIFQKN